MSKHTHETGNDISSLAEDARDLMAATADVAGEKVAEARKRLAAALDTARNKAVQGAKAVDEAVHEHPYQAIAIGVGVGALIGYLLARRNRD
ncbi:MAG TPA: DUF883 family protein [Verrucomicrobiae bacterium]|jgi:ElaB/YqjD/DUF883 family membrane-anchored ribosome-binding protein|nr:DUF883 family protein [Verrucomicrobiae bacterium]